MDLRKDCELVEVEYQNDKKKAVMTFLDIENGEILEVNFNRQEYDQEKSEFVDSPEKAEKVDKWCEEYFGTDYDSLSTKIGEKKDIYHYDNFNSLWEADILNKFEKEDEGKIIQTEIENIVDDGQAIRIYFLYNDKKYESKMNYSKYVEELKKYFPDPVKKTKQYEKFEKKFGIPVEKSDEIVGKDIMAEVKIAFNKYPYVEIKTPDWA